MNRLTLAVAGIATATLGVSACGTSASTTDTATAGSGNSTIVATTTVWGNVAEQIAQCAGGTVTTLMPIGADPHDFTPSSDQVAEVVGADLVIANGLGLEEGLTAAMDSAVQDGATVFEVAPLLDPMPFAATADGDAAAAAAAEGDDHGHEGDDHDHEGDDPHVWLDVSRVVTAAELIGAEMAGVTGDDAYTQCGLDVAEELRATNAEVIDILAQVPAGQRIMVTDHDAFEYFAGAYDFTIAGVAIPGGSTLAQTSSAELAELATTINDTGVPAIFANTANPTALVEALAGEVGDVAVVELYVGSLGDQASGADTYQGMMTTNATRIADALAN